MCHKELQHDGVSRWQLCKRGEEDGIFCHHRNTSSTRGDDYPPTPPRSNVSSGSDRSSKRRSGSTIYVGSSKGSEISQLSTSPSSHSYHMDSPPTSRSSGRRDSVDYEYERPERKTRFREPAEEDREPRPTSSSGRRASSSGRRPSSSGRRPSVRVEVMNEPPSPVANTRARRHSRHSSRDNSDREELRERRINDLLDDKEREQKALEAEIAKENDAINNRPSIPLVSPPSSATSSSSKSKRQAKERSTKERSTKERSTKERPAKESTKVDYRRGSVAFNTPEDITRQMQSLQLQSQYELREEERERQASIIEASMAKAQKQRLQDRMNGSSRESSSRESREPRSRDSRPPQTQIAPRAPRRQSLSSATRRPTVSYESRPSISYDNARPTVSYDKNSRPTVAFEDPYNPYRGY